MKKSFSFIIVFVSLTLLFTFASCNFGTNEKQLNQSLKSGTATFSIVVPDYYAMAGLSSDSSRAIAPQSTKIKLSYKKLTADDYGNYTSRWISIKTLNLNEAEKTSISDAPQGFIGSVYKCVFPNIPAGAYPKKYLKIELLDSNNKTISSALNDENIFISMEEKTQLTFYTMPETIISNTIETHSLEAGKMIFFKQIFDSDFSSILTISVTNENSYPHLVVFNEKGMFEEYITISADTKIIDCDEFKGTTKYLGFWSPKATTFSQKISFKITEEQKAAYAINQDFESTPDETVWIGQGACAKIINCYPTFEYWDHCTDILGETHNKVYQLGVQGPKGFGNSNLTIKQIKTFEPSALSFDYKCDLPPTTYLEVYIDDETTPAFKATGYNQIWQKGSVTLSEGTHTVKFETKYGNYYMNNGTNSVALDNITLAPDETACVDIYPKGLQETYVNGSQIQFTANALRSDGSVIDGKNVTWSATGGTINTDGLFTPGSTAQTVTVTATIDGKTASNTTVKIHGKNYCSDPVTINGHTFTGAITPGALTRTNTPNITFEDPTPATKTFYADGFFVLKGHASTYVYLEITKDPDYKTYYIIPPGDFEQRIWLRFGKGEHYILISEATVEFAKNYDGYEGALLGITSYYPYGPNTTNFTAYNQADLKNEIGNSYTDSECSLLMPSYYCQSDDFIVSNLFNSIMAELPENATIGQKLAAIHDWEIRNLYYDNLSAQKTDLRKKQDALHVIKYGTAVCDGYANLFAALARHLGVLTAYQRSTTMNHAWIECYYDNEWKLIDVTWDDPVSDTSVNNTANDSKSENYKYFLIKTTGVNNDHKGNVTDYERSAVETKKVSLPFANYSLY